jgi:hypothetical protein
MMASAPSSPLPSLVPQERKEAFLRLSRQLKEFGDHNPELLRIVEAMGFLSLYTEHLPQRLTAGIAGARAQLTAELKALHAAQLNSLAGANDQLQKHVAALHAAGQSAQSLATQLSFPDVDKIRATVESNSQTAQTVANAASTISQRLAVNRIWHLIIIAGLGILYFIGGAWFVWNDHHNVQRTIYEHVAARTKDAIERLQPDYIKQHLGNLKALLDTGVSISVERNQLFGDTVLFFQGTNGVSLYYPRYVDGKYAINVLQ